MSISKTPTIAPFPSWSVEQDASSHRYSSLPTAQSMRTKSLFGLPLKSYMTGEEVTDETLEKYIVEAISQVEHELDMYITPTVFEERHDYNREMQFWSFGYTKLNHAPILNVEKYQLTFNNGINIPGSLPLVDIPLEFVHVQPQEGTIQLVPAQGVTISGFIVSIYSGLGYHAFNSQAISNWPGATFVRYTAGFEKDKIPALLSSLIENIAAFKFLSALGPVLFPHNSVSIGIDGASQSVGTMGPNFLTKRLQDLQAIIQGQTEAARGYYQKRFLIDYL
jgi:hypothetical protein